MGAVGVSIEVSGDGDRAALHEAIWDEITEWVRMYTADSANEQVLEYVLDADHDEEQWGAVDDSLCWMFPDCAGCCNRSADAWAHWTQLALASEWERIVQLADEHDLRITSEPRTLDDLLVDRPGYVSLRGNLWDARENGLYGDSESLELSELDDNERARYQAARVRCMCGPCTMLRADADTETAMVRGLAKTDTAGPAGWYIARMHRTSPGTLEALVKASCPDMLRDSVERYAMRLPSTWDTLIALLPSLTGYPRGRAFYALATTKLDDARRSRLVHELRAALAGSDVAAEAAAEVAGVVGRDVPELDEQLAAVLDRKVSEELRHNVVLGLVNLHVPKRAPSPTVRKRIEREAKRDTEAGRLASWFVSAF